jgi:hypothetical protein
MNKVKEFSVPLLIIFRVNARVILIGLGKSEHPSKSTMLLEVNCVLMLNPPLGESF